MSSRISPLTTSRLVPASASALRSNGGLPMSSSWARMPSPHQSEAALRPWPLSTSGGMYSSVPIAVYLPQGAEASSRSSASQDFELKLSGASLGLESQRKVRALFAIDPLGRTEVG